MTGMTYSDKPGARAVRFALLGAGMGGLALVLVLGTLLFGDDQRVEREKSPARARTDVASTPAAVTASPTPPG